MHRVELTDAGEATFQRLLGALSAFDRQLRSGIDDQEVVVISDILTRLQTNAVRGSVV